MLDRLKLSMKAMELLTRAQEVIANNLANINTPGFKGEKVFYRSFSDVMNGQKVQNADLYQTVQMEQGRLESTGNPYDFAIEGKGFFQVENNGQMLLTRNGRFHLDSNGYLRDSNDGFVQGASGAIQIPNLGKNDNSASNENKIEVARDGTIRLNDKILDKLNLVKVTDLTRLKRLSGTYFKPQSDNIVEADTSSQVNQGYYEGGNVNPMKEMVAMTKNLQLFESQQKVISSSNQSLSQATNNLGKF